MEERSLLCKWPSEGDVSVTSLACSAFESLRFVLQTATLYPAVVFGICFFLNFFIWGEHSSGAVSCPSGVWRRG